MLVRKQQLKFVGYRAHIIVEDSFFNRQFCCATVDFTDISATEEFYRKLMYGSIEDIDKELKYIKNEQDVFITCLLYEHTEHGEIYELQLINQD